MVFVCHKYKKEETRLCYEHDGLPEARSELLKSASQPVETTTDTIEAAVNVKVLSRLYDHMKNLRTLVAEGADGLYRKFRDCPSAKKAQFLRDINAQLGPLASDLGKLPKTFKIGKKIISDDMMALLEGARSQMGIMVDISPDWKATLHAIDLNEEHLDGVKTEAIRATTSLEQIQATLRIVRDPDLVTATNNNAVNVLYAGFNFFGS